MNQALKSVRSTMKEEGIDILIITDHDPHLSEYIAPYWQIRQWLSGFTGSAGTLVITADHAGLWTDSRYFLQAAEEIQNTGFDLHKVIHKEDQYINWIADNSPDRKTIGIDGRLISVSSYEQLKKELASKKMTYKANCFIASDNWTTHRPELSVQRIFAHDVRYAGIPVKEKLKQIRTHLSEEGIDWYVISALDSIAWLFNLRGRDVEFNPVFYAFGLIGRQDAYLFVDQDKVPLAIAQDLERDNIYIDAYERIYSLTDYCFGSIGYDRLKTNLSLYQSINRLHRVHISCPIEKAKSEKSIIEVQHTEQAMIQDGVALVNAFHWLYNNLESGEIHEYDFAQRIAEQRSKQPGYFGESFPAIVGYNANAAIVHYRPKAQKSAQIKTDGILLCDSGGQYINGTTDITRTIALGSEIPKEIKNDFTRVLKGHIQLAKAVFPIGTTGGQLDILARQFLWEAGQNFGHGTGHGVGYFLNVHEGPQAISSGQSRSVKIPLKEGMIVSNEPGYYQTGSHGIRIENLILVEPSEHQGYLQFKTLTLFPFDTSLINKEFLSQCEIDWINQYHDRVYKSLSPLLEKQTADWLKKQCAPI